MGKVRKSFLIIFFILLAVSAAVFCVYKAHSLLKSNVLKKTTPESAITPFGGKLIIGRAGQNAEQITDSFTAMVISWDSGNGFLTVNREGEEKTYIISVPENALIIRKNASSGSKDETVVLSKSSSNWPTAFCTGDTVEVTAPKTATGGAVIRNKGDRKCAF